MLAKISAERLQTEDVKRYLLKCIKDGLSENGMHSRINALKFLYEHILAGKAKSRNTKGCKLSQPASFFCNTCIRERCRHQVYKGHPGAFQYKNY